MRHAIDETESILIILYSPRTKADMRWGFRMNYGRHESSPVEIPSQEEWININNLLFRKFFREGIRFQAFMRLDEVKLNSAQNVIRDGIFGEQIVHVDQVNVKCVIFNLQIQRKAHFLVLNSISARFAWRKANAFAH